MAKLTVEIVTAERRVSQTEVDMIIAPGTEGEIGILPKHAPLLTALNPGVMVLKNDGQEEVLAVSGGFLQVANNRVLILADTAERAEELDEARAQEARASAEAALKEAAKGSMQADAARAALQRSLVRLNVARRRRRTTM
jgi:F-type H+-transporting ATPase subunit epsilon